MNSQCLIRLRDKFFFFGQPMSSTLEILAIGMDMVMLSPPYDLWSSRKLDVCNSHMCLIIFCCCLSLSFASLEANTYLSSAFVLHGVGIIQFTLMAWLVFTLLILCMYKVAPKMNRFNLLHTKLNEK